MDIVMDCPRDCAEATRVRHSESLCLYRRAFKPGGGGRNLGARNQTDPTWLLQNTATLENIMDHCDHYDHCGTFGSNTENT